MWRHPSASGELGNTYFYITALKIERVVEQVQLSVGRLEVTHSSETRQ